jgi:hypothetical protein
MAMNTPVSPNSLASIKLNLPTLPTTNGGKWHEPNTVRYVEQTNPGTGDSLGKAADSGAQDIDAATCRGMDDIDAGIGAGEISANDPSHGQ